MLSSNVNDSINNIDFSDYYNKTEVDNKLGTKANSSHTHTKSQITDLGTIGTAASKTASTSTSAKTSSGNVNILANTAELYQTYYVLNTAISGRATSSQLQSLANRVSVLESNSGSGGGSSVIYDKTYDVTHIEVMDSRSSSQGIYSNPLSFKFYNNWNGTGSSSGFSDGYGNVLDKLRITIPNNDSAFEIVLSSWTKTHDSASSTWDFYAVVEKYSVGTSYAACFASSQDLYVSSSSQAVYQVRGGSCYGLSIYKKISTAATSPKIRLEELLK